jgi:protein ImuB
MMLWACLLFPSLSLDVFLRGLPPSEAAVPFAVTTGGRAPRIVCANAAAHAAGARPRQAVSAALAFAPDIALRERNTDAEASALEALATAMTPYTPTVVTAPPDAVLAEIGGCLRLFGGLPRLTAELARRAHDLGYTVRIAVAPTAAAAVLLARMDDSDAATTEVTDPAALERALSSVPLALSDIDADVIAMLASTGVTTIGEACALPRDALARRTGPAFVDFLDRARGLVPDARAPFVPPPRYAGKIDLPSTVESAEALAFALNRLVHEMAGWLAGRGLGVLEMSVALAHERSIGAKVGISATTASFALAAPTRDPAHLNAVLRERLARIALPAPVETIRLASAATTPLAGRNLALLPGDNPAPTVPLIDRLRARLGDDAVTLVALHDEHRPERAWRESRIVRNDSGSEVKRAATYAARPRAVAPRRAHDATIAFTAPRPLWLLAEPAPIGHLLEAQPWVLRDGPERIESGWWDGVDVRRDYFVAENPRGEVVWIYRDHRYGIEDGEWFMHGMFA